MSILQRPIVAHRRRRFGNQGAAQAQNLRDSGIPNDKIIIANRDDHYAADAKSRQFHVEHDFGKATKDADGTCVRSRTRRTADTTHLPDSAVIFLLIPDQSQPRVFNELIAPTLKPTAAIVVASGYNVFFKLLNIPTSNDVVMVAPRCVRCSRFRVALTRCAA